MPQIHWVWKDCSLRKQQWKKEIPVLDFINNANFLGRFPVSPNQRFSCVPYVFLIIHVVNWLIFQPNLPENTRRIRNLLVGWKLKLSTFRSDVLYQITCWCPIGPTCWFKREDIQKQLLCPRNFPSYITLEPLSAN